MNIYKKYLFNNLLKPFLLSFFIILGIVWLTRIVNYVSYLTEYNISLSLFINMIILVIPNILTLIIIISLIISIINTYNRLLNNNELVILKNAGLDNKKLVLPIIYFSFILFLICFYIASYLTPNSNKKLEIIKNNIYNDVLNVAFKENDFNKIKNTTFYVKYRNGDILESVIVSINNKENEYDTIYAKNAIIDGNTIKFSNGNIHKYNNTSNDTIYFDEFIFNLNEFYNEKEDDSLSLDSMNLNELLKLDVSEYNRKNYIKYLYQISSKISMSFLCFVMGIFSGAMILNKSFSRRNNLYTTFVSLSAMILFVIMSYLIKNGEKNIYSIYISNIMNILIFIFSMVNLKKKV